MSHSLFGFSTFSFEQFVHVLGLQVFGPGTIIFGRGPDGGRESTFNGKVPYPFETDNWNGYGVIQAKYKEKTEGTQLDQEWALGMLKKELDGFFNSQKRNPKPQYYVFCTNVVLTAAVGGGKDLANDLIKSYYSKLPLKGHAVWDYDQITSFINQYESIRKRYRAYLTPGDLISAIISWIESRSPDYETIITTYLDRELRGETDAKLDQAGQRTDDRVPLSKIFFDLPTTSEPTKEVEDEKEHEGRLPVGFLYNILKVGEQALDSKSLYESKCIMLNGSVRECVNRFLIIGGPGSGKSTLMQFLAQIYRASILEKRPQHKLLPETIGIMKGIKEHCAVNHLPWPSTPRLVLKVELSIFAKCLANKETTQINTLAQYLVYKIKGDKEFALGDLFRILEQYPSLLVLDGLDEVPSSTNRSEVVKEVENFLAEATLRDCNILLLATTRPEGYNNEFGKDTFRYNYAKPLSLNRALKYVRSFLGFKYGKEYPRNPEILDTIKSAAENELTAKLMTTPLQVTFMVTLTCAGGRPPRDRWNLFHQYYDTIYKREQQKGDELLRSVLENYSPLVHKLHQKIGFVLQVRGENTGGADTMMLKEELQKTIRGYLREDEWEPEDTKIIEQLLNEVALMRLVLLVFKVPERVSFDVRSIQEYMAAESIVSGESNILSKRLESIASIPFWRNAFLFAAGKCFVNPEYEYLKPTIKQICETINDIDLSPILSLLKVGSILSLDILEDGTVTNTPKYLKAFIRIALEAIDTPYNTQFPGTAENLHIRLARFCDSKTENIFREVLETKLQVYHPHLSHAWALLLELSAKGFTWAQSILKSKTWLLTKHLEEIFDMCFSLSVESQFITEFLEYVIPRINPALLRTNGKHYAQSKMCGNVEKKWMLRALFFASSGECANFVPVNFDDDTIDVVDLGVMSLQETDADGYYNDLIHMPHPGTFWLPYLILAKSNKKLDQYVCAEILTALADNLNDIKDQWDILPWPIGVCLAWCETKEELLGLAKRMERGGMGTLSDWEEAEKRWLSKGITVDDLFFEEENIPFSKSIAKHGFAFPYTNWRIMHKPEVKNVLKHFSARFPTLSCLQRKRFISNLILSVFRCLHSVGVEDDLMEPSVLKILLPAFYGNQFNVDCLMPVKWPDIIEPEYISVLNTFGERISSFTKTSWIYTIRNTAFIEQLEASYIANPRLNGILKILSGFCEFRYVPRIPTRLLQNYKSFETDCKAAAIKIILKQCAYEKREIEALAEEAVRVVKQERFENYIESIINVIQTVEINENLQEFTTCLLKKLRETQLPNMSCYLNLYNILRGMKSGFLEDEIR